MNGIELTLDVFMPNRGTAPYPVVVFIHGGSWSAGSKSSAALMPETSLLMNAGFVIASIDYRLSSENTFPAQIQDVKCAIRFLRATTDQWNIDPNRIAAWGNSAGGHLAALAGVTNKVDGWDVGQYLKYSSQVQTVIDMYGPTDLTDPEYMGIARGTLENLFGIRNLQDPIVRAASPFYQVTRAAPPFLIIHGDDDTIVPISQSRNLYKKLKSLGMEPRLIVVLNAGHGLGPVGAAETTPSRSQVAQAVVNFLLNHMK